MSRRWQFEPFDNTPFGRRPPDLRMPSLPRRFWIGLAVIGLVVLLLIVLQPIVGFFTDLLWFGGLGLQGVYLTRAELSFGLFAVVLLLAFGFSVVNAALALRMRMGALSTIGIRRRYLRTPAGLGALAAAAAISLILAASAGRHWNDLALFLHASPTGTTEPVFGQDVSFYLLTLPFLHDLVNWAAGIVFLTLLITIALYVWRAQGLELRLSPLAVAHVSALMALFAVVLAFTTWLSRYDFMSGHTSYVWGPGYTDINARIPLTYVAAVLALLLAIALAVNVRLRRLAWPVAAVAAWIAFGILSGLYGAAVQRLAVTPNELGQERQYIQREIQFTRKAYGLDHVSTTNFTGDTPVSASDISGDRATIDNLRLWDHRPLLDTYPQLQAIRSYYTFNDIDLDRYALQGQRVQLELSARELDTDTLATIAPGWVNTKLKYTHGYGLAASYVNAATKDGDPVFVARDIPVQGQLNVTQPDIYFGERTNDYVLAPSAEREFDFAQGGQDVYTAYKGTHGVRMDGAARLLFSLRTGDFNLMISPQIQARTQMLFRRNIVDRARMIAPFLSYDADPYLVVGSDGRMYWIIDAYTSSSAYPYSAVTGSNGNLPDLNYIRNSVKVVVDAYEGTTSFYVAAPNDPLVRAYSQTFPGLFHPLSELPADLSTHLRVPEGLFTIQTNAYRTYHMTDPQVFYNQEDLWAVANEQTSPNSDANPLQPFYVLMRLPGDATPEYLLILPFTPNGKQNMISELAARCDPEHYGQLVSISLPKDKVIFGPQQISRRIYETPEISRDFTLLGQVGSNIIQGNLLVVPVGNSFLYFEPVYLKATGSGQSFPELKKVILADSSQVVYANTLSDALAALTGASPPPTNNGPPPVVTGSSNKNLQSLANQALQHYQAAQDRLKAGDLSGYAQEMQTVGQLLQQMQSSSPSPSPSPSPKP